MHILKTLEVDRFISNCLTTLIKKKTAHEKFYENGYILLLFYFSLFYFILV